MWSGKYNFLKSGGKIPKQDKRKSDRKWRINSAFGQNFGQSVIIGFQKTQIYQRFAGSRQEVFILKIQNDENNAAQHDNGRRYARYFRNIRPVECLYDKVL